jgi:hypothetical protein
MTTSDIATSDIVERPAEYPLVASPQVMQGVLQMIDDNFSQQRFDVLKLPRIRVLRDAAMFQVETAAGLLTERILSGILGGFRTARVYWGDRPYNPTLKQPPACTSTDGFVGIGEPGGNCRDCPFAKFKTARNADGSQGAGQACRELRQMLFLLPGQILPHRLDVSPTSLQLFEKYTITLLCGGIPYWAVVTKLSLEVGTTSTGMTIPRIQFLTEKRLNGEETRIMRPYHERMRGLLAPMEVDVDRYEITGEGGPPAAPAAPPPSDIKDDDIPF